MRLWITAFLLLFSGVASAQSLSPNQIGGCFLDILMSNCPTSSGASGGSGVTTPPALLLNDRSGFLTFNDGGLILLQGYTGYLLLNNGTGNFLLYNDGSNICLNANPSC